MTIQEIRGALIAAYQTNDEGKIRELEGQLNIAKKAEQDAEIKRQQEEAKALEGARQAIATAIHTAVNGLVIDGKKIKPILDSVKATGFIYKLDVTASVDTDGKKIEGVVFKSVALTVPTIKLGKGKCSIGNNGGRSGRTMEEYGISLDEVFQAHKNADDVAAFEAAEGLEPKARNTKQWQIKTAVKKRVIEAGILKANS